jgi:hypothetical protein
LNLKLHASKFRVDHFINISELVSKLNMYYQLDYYHSKYTSTRLRKYC